MKMEASASSATSTEKKEPPAAWPSTLSTRVLQLPADGHHLDGHICSSLSFAAAAPTCRERSRRKASVGPASTPWAASTATRAG